MTTFVRLYNLIETVLCRGRIAKSEDMSAATTGVVIAPAALAAPLHALDSRSHVPAS